MQTADAQKSFQNKPWVIQPLFFVDFVNKTVMRNRVKAALSVNPACLNPSTFLPDVDIVSKVIFFSLKDERKPRIHIWGPCSAVNGRKW